MPPNYSSIIQTNSEQITDCMLFSEKSRVAEKIIIIKENGYLE